MNRYSAEHIIMNGRDNIQKWQNRYFVEETEVAELQRQLTMANSVIASTQVLLDKLNKELMDVYIDENRTAWTRPTAWAYAQVCKAREKWQRQSERAEKQIANQAQTIRNYQDESTRLRQEVGRADEARRHAQAVGTELVTTVRALEAELAGLKHGYARGGFVTTPLRDMVFKGVKG